MSTITYTANPYGRKVLFCTTEKALRRAAKRFNCPPVPDALGAVYDAPGGPLVLFVRDGKRATLVHECCHAVLNLLEHYGVDPVASNGEPMAYLLDHMYEHFEPHLAPAWPSP